VELSLRAPSTSKAASRNSGPPQPSEERRVQAHEHDIEAFPQVVGGWALVVNP